MAQPNVEDTPNNVVRKKRIIQEVVIKIEMTGGYIEDGDEAGADKNDDGETNKVSDGSKEGEGNKEGASLTSQAGSIHDGGSQGGGSQGGGSHGGGSQGGGSHGGGSHGGGSQGGGSHGEGNQGDQVDSDGQAHDGTGQGTDGENTDGDGEGTDQDNQDGANPNEDETSKDKAKCPEFAPCADILKQYSYTNETDQIDPTKPGEPKTQEQIDAEKAADKFLSVGPDLVRCSPTTECDPDNNSIIKYKSVCPDDEVPEINEDDLEYDENKLVRLNWKKVKRFLRAACPSRKLKLLQALRLRLCDVDTNKQEKTARDIVKHDLFDVKQLCCGRSLLDDLLWPTSVSLPHPVQDCAARLFNALVSMDIGREYMKDVSIIQTLTWGRSLRSIVEHSDHTTVDIHTGNMLIGIMMKLSIIPFQRKDMVRKGLLKWLIIHFEDMEQQANSYHLEYASALLMMLLTVPNSSEVILDQTRQLLAFFIRILKTPGNTSWPYIRLAMLSLFRSPKVASNAKTLNLPDILQQFLSQTNDQTEKQSINDVLDQLDNPASISIEDIENQATELATDKLYVDEEIIKSDPVNCLPEIGGEDLFKSKFPCKKSRKKEVGSPVSQRSNNSLKKPCQLKNCMKSKDDPLKSYNENTHTFENIPNKTEIFPRPSKPRPTDQGKGLPGPSSKAPPGSSRPGQPNLKKTGTSANDALGSKASLNGNEPQEPIKGSPPGPAAGGAKSKAPAASPGGKPAATAGAPPAATAGAPPAASAGAQPAATAGAPPGATAGAPPAPAAGAPPAATAGAPPAATAGAPPAASAGSPPAKGTKDPKNAAKMAPNKGKVGPTGSPDQIVQNLQVTQQITSPLPDGQLDDKMTKIYSDPTLNITATKISPPTLARPGLNFNIRPLRNSEKNRTLKIVCNTDTEQTENFLCTVFETNGDDTEDTVVGTATISTTQNEDGTINATVNQVINDQQPTK